MTIKSYVALFVFLAGCSTITNTLVKDKLDNTARKKIFELDLTDKGISSESGGIELFKEKEYCNLELSLYDESGQQKYNFLFKENNLIKTTHKKYQYKMDYYLLIIDFPHKSFFTQLQIENSSNQIKA